MRIIAAAACVASDGGAASLSVAQVVRRAGVSRRTFYEFFEDRNACLLAAFDYSLGLVIDRARVAYDSRVRWTDRVRAGVAASLQFFDEQPSLARVCVVESAAAGPAAFARRCEVLDGLLDVVDEGRVLARVQPPPFAGEIVVGGALSVIGTRMMKPDSGPLIDLLNPLMSMIVLPYRGAAAARKQLSRTPPEHVAAPVPMIKPNPFEGLSLRVTDRTLAVLLAISAEAGLSNLELSERAGITDQAQISRLLARLSQHGLIENTGGGQRLGTTNAWRLTLAGRQLEPLIAYASPTRGAA